VTAGQLMVVFGLGFVVYFFWLSNK